MVPTRIKLSLNWSEAREFRIVARRSDLVRGLDSQHSKQTLLYQSSVCFK